MKRTRSQIFFNHLPGQMQRDTGTKLITQVVSVQSSPSDSGFREKIMERAGQMLKAKGIVTPVNPFRETDYTLARVDAAVQELFPTMLQCQTCSRIRYTTLDNFRGTSDMASMLAWCPTCRGSNLKQLDLVVFHECGMLDQPKMRPCGNSNHGFKFIILDRGSSQNPMHYNWRCSECQKVTGPFFDGSQHRGCAYDYCTVDDSKKPQKAVVKSYRDSGVFRRQGFELVNHNRDTIVKARSDPRAPLVLFRMHLGNLPPADITSHLSPDADNKAGRAAALKVEAVLESQGKKLEDLAALKQADDPVWKLVEEYAKPRGIDLGALIGDKSKGEFAEMGLDAHRVSQQPIVDELMDFYQLRHPVYKLQAWADWAERARRIPTFDLDMLEITRATMDSLGLLDCFYLPRLPIANVAVGYERGRLKSTNRAIKLFPQIGSDSSDQVRPFYLHEVQTEAIVFQLRAAAVLKWLRLQGSPVVEVPEDPDESGARAFLINSLDWRMLEERKYDELDDPLTDYVYSLLHTMSHSLLKSINPFSGDDSTNMGEIIFPFVPGFAIFLRKVSEFTLGSIEYLYQRNLVRWLSAARAQVASCINDPSCRMSPGKSSCFGCLQGSEISCARFNRSLNRELLFDFPGQSRYRGFWTVSGEGR